MLAKMRAGTPRFARTPFREDGEHDPDSCDRSRDSHRLTGRSRQRAALAVAQQKPAEQRPTELAERDRSAEQPEVLVVPRGLGFARDHGLNAECEAEVAEAEERTRSR